MRWTAEEPNDVGAGVLDAELNCRYQYTGETALCS